MPSPVLLILRFFARRDDLVQSYLILWGRMASCGRLAIGLTIFLHITRRIANPPQVTNLPHMIRINLRRSRAVRRHQFGEPIAGFQGVQFELGKWRLKVEASRLLVYNSARLRDAGLPFATEAAMPRATASMKAPAICKG